MKKPPIIVFVDGISLIPSQGSHTQKIPPMTSVKDNKVNSAAGIFFDPIEYKINPTHTNVPCVANNASFFPEDKKLKSLDIIIKDENKKQINPAKATVVNFGVSFLHLKETENIANPIAEINPKSNPKRDPFGWFPKAIIDRPMAAINIDIKTLVEIFSFKNRKPNKAVINGIAAKHKRVIAADVVVIDHIKVIMANPSPVPPINPDKPILK